jgi:hypothetical protein
MAASEKPVTDILGSPDDMQFRSCMTLFDAVSKQEIFAEAIAAFYLDGMDRATLEILETSRSPQWSHSGERELGCSILVLSDAPRRTD